MKVIALKGESSCGKTTTLNIVYSLLLEAECIQISGKFQDLCNNDCLDILKLGNTLIGIVTQGDYAIGECSVKNHLRYLEQEKCDIAVCACTIGLSKRKIEEAIKSYPNHKFVTKTKSADISLERVENTKKALEIKKLILD